MFDSRLEPPQPVLRLEVLTGASGRRRWLDGEKARMLEEATMPATVVFEVARHHGMTLQHLFTWPRQARRYPTP
jgi:transposase